MKYSILLFLSLFVAIACSDNDDDLLIAGIDCDQLKDSFMSDDFTYPQSKIDSICMTLPAAPTASDPIGHEENTKTLIDQLNASCDQLNFELDCYACLESLPLQSSLKVIIDSSNGPAEVNFRLFVPENDFMYMSN